MINRYLGYLKSFLVASILLTAITACTKEQVIHIQANKSPGSMVIDLAKTVTLADTIAQNARARVIYVSETHNAYEDHLMQLEVLKAMHAQPGNLAIGVEWFQWPFQEHLDAYLTGSISETEMLVKTEYFDRWRFDYRLYRPIIEYAKIRETFGKPLSKKDCEGLLDDYYDERGWDVQTGIPREETLVEIGLEDVAIGLKKGGHIN